MKYIVEYFDGDTQSIKEALLITKYSDIDLNEDYDSYRKLNKKV